MPQNAHTNPQRTSDSPESVFGPLTTLAAWQVSASRCRFAFLRERRQRIGLRKRVRLYSHQETLDGFARGAAIGHQLKLGTARL
jgi:hypothetical protein